MIEEELQRAGAQLRAQLTISSGYDNADQAEGKGTETTKNRTEQTRIVHDDFILVSSSPVKMTSEDLAALPPRIPSRSSAKTTKRTTKTGRIARSLSGNWQAANKHSSPKVDRSPEHSDSDEVLFAHLSPEANDTTDNTPLSPLENMIADSWPRTHDDDWENDYVPEDDTLNDHSSLANISANNRYNEEDGLIEDEQNSEHEHDVESLIEGQEADEDEQLLQKADSNSIDQHEVGISEKDSDDELSNGDKVESSATHPA